MAALAAAVRPKCGPKLRHSYARDRSRGVGGRRLHGAGAVQRLASGNGPGSDATAAREAGGQRVAHVPDGGHFDAGAVAVDAAERFGHTSAGRPFAAGAAVPFGAEETGGE